MREKDYIMEEVTYNHKLPARILHQKVTGLDCYVPLHWHKEIELNLMLKGNTEFVANGVPYRRMEGELILINSGVLHLGAVPKGEAGFEENLELLTILWNYDFLSDFAEDIPALEFDLDMDFAAKEKIHSMIYEIGQLYIKREKFFEMRITALLLNIGSLLMEFCLVPEQQLAASNLRKAMDQMQQAVNFIEENCRTDLSLPDVAAQMGMAPTYFSRKFRSTTGITFHEFLTRCRLKCAMNDLNNTDLNVTEIAFRNGFPNVKAFISTFKRCYQTTPKQYQASRFQN